MNEKDVTLLFMQRESSSVKRQRHRVSYKILTHQQFYRLGLARNSHEHCPSLNKSDNTSIGAGASIIANRWTNIQ